LLDVAVTATVLLELWLTLIVFVAPMPRIRLTGSVVIVHGVTGDGLGLGVAGGDGLGLGRGVAVGDGVGGGGPPPRSGVGVGTGAPSLDGVGVGVGCAPSTRGGVGIGVATPIGVGVGVALEARSPTRKFTFGTESSNTRLSIVMSPEPVTSTETESLLFFNLIETCALGVVTPSTVFHVRPRQSKEMVSIVSKLTSLGSGIL